MQTVNVGNFTPFSIPSLAFLFDIDVMTMSSNEITNNQAHRYDQQELTNHNPNMYKVNLPLRMYNV